MSAKPLRFHMLFLDGMYGICGLTLLKHDHGLEDPTPLVEFVMKHARE